MAVNNTLYDLFIVFVPECQCQLAVVYTGSLFIEALPSMHFNGKVEITTSKLLLIKPNFYP